MKLTLRNATLTDVAAMHRVRLRVRENRLSQRGRVTEADYRAYVAAGTIWVADSENGILGFAAIDATTSSVWALFIEPAAEGSGIGRALHDTMLDWARAQRIPHLTLNTEEGSRAERFYSRAGWRVTSRINGEVHFDKFLLG